MGARGRLGAGEQGPSGPAREKIHLSVDPEIKRRFFALALLANVDGSVLFTRWVNAQSKGLVFHLRGSGSEPDAAA
jgi:hypothetical protein